MKEGREARCRKESEAAAPRPPGSTRNHCMPSSTPRSAWLRPAPVSRDKSSGSIKDSYFGEYRNFWPCGDVWVESKDPRLKDQLVCGPELAEDVRRRGPVTQRACHHRLGPSFLRLTSSSAACCWHLPRPAPASLFPHTLAARPTSHTCLPLHRAIPRVCSTIVQPDAE